MEERCRAAGRGFVFSPDNSIITRNLGIKITIFSHFLKKKFFPVLAAAAIKLQLSCNQGKSSSSATARINSAEYRQAVFTWHGIAAAPPASVWVWSK